MEKILSKYVDKIKDAGLAEPENILLGFLDADLVWNKKNPMTNNLAKIFQNLSINSLLFAKPNEPYRSIIDNLAQTYRKVIYPSDTETRTFIHDLPIVNDFNIDKIIKALKNRKCVIIPEQGVLTYGIVSPEQAFIFFSSVCFATFVKFFSDHLEAYKLNQQTSKQMHVFDNVVDKLYQKPSDQNIILTKGPFYSEKEVIQAIDEVGKEVVENKLVDSFFGNVSYRLNNILYISQTSSSLDELPGFIDPCPLDDSSCAAITASSELTAHQKIVKDTDQQAILHGHPKFSVIMSMDCRVKECQAKGECHRRCPYHREVVGVPIVSGEVGTGPYGLCRTVPEAIKGNKGVIVYGHGVFTTGQEDFRRAFRNLLEIENNCRDEYFERIKIKN